MTSRERLTRVLRRQPTDCVPVSPDTSNMIPARMTGKPFWRLYLYNDPPLWEANIACAKYFDYDMLMECYGKIKFDELDEIDHDAETVIVYRDEEKLITRTLHKALGHEHWSRDVDVYYHNNPPARGILPEKIGLDKVPSHYEHIEGKNEYPEGAALLKLMKEKLGDQGILGVCCGVSKLLHSEQDIYDYYDDPEPFYERRERLLKYYKKRFDLLMSLDVKPDFITTGASGTLIHQTPDIFRELALPIVQQTTAMAKAHGLPTHVHSCGPEKALVKILAEETDLTVIEPLEIAPMGDCDLKELKRLYGDKLVLKGNLHTTTVMLDGTPDDVRRAARQAIDDAAAGGGFILSSGDQCGRDTPDENLFAMVETARTYGKY